MTCLESAIGPEPNLLADSELHAKKILIPLPVVNSDEMAQLKRLDRAKILGGYYKPFIVKGLYQVAGGGQALKDRLDEIFQEIDEAIENGANFLVLSDRDSNYAICCAATRVRRSPWWSKPAMCAKSTMWHC